MSNATNIATGTREEREGHQSFNLDEAQFRSFCERLGRPQHDERLALLLTRKAPWETLRTDPISSMNELIDAAAEDGVRHMADAEFEGWLTNRLQRRPDSRI